MNRALILGAGPAGISAALYLQRAGAQATVLHHGKSALQKAAAIENYYGFPEPVSGEELYRRGMAGAKRLGVSFVEDEAVGLSWDGDFTVEGLADSYRAEIVILALGTQRAAPPLPGLDRLEGRGVSWCAVCDAFFFRGKDVAVLGGGQYALHEAALLARTSASVTVLTNGAPTLPAPQGVRVVETPVLSLEGETALQGVRLQDGSLLPVAGLFVAMGSAGSVGLARKVGAVVSDNQIVTDEHGATNVPGLYAAGDCTGGVLQVSKAVWDGARAALHAISVLNRP